MTKKLATKLNPLELRFLGFRGIVYKRAQDKIILFDMNTYSPRLVWMSWTRAGPNHTNSYRSFFPIHKLNSPNVTLHTTVTTVS